jgi:SulP family sulfate permease
LTVFVDLVVAVNVGVVLASFVFMRRMAQAVSVAEHSHDELADEAGTQIRLPRDTVVYTIDGPFFFGAAENLENALRRSQSHVRTLVIRMGRVPFMDATGLTALDEIIEDFQRTGARVVLVEVRPNVLEKLERSRILARVGAGGHFGTLAEYAATLEAAEPHTADAPR